MQSENINELAAALAKAQGQIEGAKKDSANPFFKSTYADLASVWDACRKQLSDNGLSIIQCPEEAENGIAIETMLLHSSGQWKSGRYVIPVAKNDAQAMGSAITYGRRYALAAMVGIAPEDDDGNAATKAKPVKSEQTKKEPLPSYSKDQFDANLQTWIHSITSGKHTPEHLINMISTKYTLTDVQKQSILNIGLENANIS